MTQKLMNFTDILKMRGITLLTEALQIVNFVEKIVDLRYRVISAGQCAKNSNKFYTIRDYIRKLINSYWR